MIPMPEKPKDRSHLPKATYAATAAPNLAQIDSKAPE